MKWQGHESPWTEPRCFCPRMASSRAHRHSASLANGRHVGWPPPPPPPPPRELLCSDFIPVPHLIKHRIHESDSNSEKEKNIFRIILEKGDMSEPLLEPRYQNTRKEERDRERERECEFFFHLPFCETICNSLLTNQFERNLRWWAFGCHGNYSAVCSHLMHL